MSELSHLDARGQAHMVDVGEKPITEQSEQNDAGNGCSSVADDELAGDQMERHLDDLEREIKEPNR